MREVDAGEGVGTEVVVTGSFVASSRQPCTLLYIVFVAEKDKIDRRMKAALTMCVLVLVVASVTGVVLLALFLVMAASAAAAKHLVEEAKLGIGEGEERQEGYQEAHFEELCSHLWGNKIEIETTSKVV